MGPKVKKALLQLNPLFSFCNMQSYYGTDGADLLSCNLTEHGQNCNMKKLK